MRKRTYLATAVVALATMALAACGSTESAGQASADTPSPTAVVGQATSTPLPATSGQQNDAVSEQRVKDLEFRISEVERLLSVEDAMFSVTDDLTAIDGRLRFQQTCLNALVLVAGRHTHLDDVGSGSTQPTPTPGVLVDTNWLAGPDGEARIAARELLEAECSRAVGQDALQALINSYGLNE